MPRPRFWKLRPERLPSCDRRADRRHAGSNRARSKRGLPAGSEHPPGLSSRGTTFQMLARPHERTARRGTRNALRPGCSRARGERRGRPDGFSWAAQARPLPVRRESSTRVKVWQGTFPATSPSLNLGPSGRGAADQNADVAPGGPSHQKSHSGDCVFRLGGFSERQCWCGFAGAHPLRNPSLGRLNSEKRNQFRFLRLGKACRDCVCLIRRGADSWFKSGRKSNDAPGFGPGSSVGFAERVVAAATAWTSPPRSPSPIAPPPAGRGGGREVESWMVMEGGGGIR